MAINIGTLITGSMALGSSGGGSSGHADTWVKYDGNTEWTPVSIEGNIEGSYGGMEEDGPTTQIPNVYDVVEIEIGTDVTSIGQYAFVYCSSLTSITISENVTSIGQWAFYCCRSLTSVTIPANVTSIGFEAFGQCPDLTSVTFNNFTKDEVKNLTTGDFYLFGEAFFDGEDNPMEKTITAICTDGSMTIHFSANYPAEVTFTNL